MDKVECAIASCQLDTPGKKDPKLRSCLLWASLCGFFLIANWWRRAHPIRMDGAILDRRVRSTEKGFQIMLTACLLRIQQLSLHTWDAFWATFIPAPGTELWCESQKKWILTVSAATCLSPSLCLSLGTCLWCCRSSPCSHTSLGIYFPLLACACSRLVGLWVPKASPVSASSLIGTLQL